MVMNKHVLKCLILALLNTSSVGLPGMAKHRPIEPQAYWKEAAQDELHKMLNRKLNTNVAKNVILFVGDGMGPTTVTAARILKGQLRNRTGEDETLLFETFPHVALSKTYNTDAQVADSAGTATAFLCGVKTRYSVVGVDDTVTRGDCDSQQGAEVSSILDWSIKEGKSVGFVTTTRVTHATPSPLYAHSADRDWEYEVPSNAKGKCKDIAMQFLDRAADIQVALGGGRRNFMPNNASDPEYPSKTGKRTDGRDLIEEWKRKMAGKKIRYVWNITDFDSVHSENTDHLLGLFEPSHMQYEAERASDPGGEPSLAQMVRKAITILQNTNGFFLMVEGGRIDHGHHDNKAGLALYDTLAFEDAVTVATQMTDESNTLVVVTGDHSHVMTLGGYSRRGNPILGLVETVDPKWATAVDRMPYTVLAYGNGPGFNHSASKFGRENLTGVDTDDLNYVQQSAVNIDSETHGGEDVAIYAKGPMAHLFQSTHEQNYIAHVMAYASCVGDNKNHCKTIPAPSNGLSSLDLNIPKIIAFIMFFLHTT